MNDNYDAGGRHLEGEARPELGPRRWTLCDIPLQCPPLRMTRNYNGGITP